MGCTEVSTSVTAIIAAFTQCREVLRKIRSKTRGRVVKNRTADFDNELRLNRSLDRAPAEIGQEYARGVQALGQPFALGDGLTQMLLQTTLAKLNTGLVDIISAFLVSKDPKKLRLDYGTLAALSDTSCIETRESLIQLGKRLARAALHLQPRSPCRRCGACGHHECSRSPNKSQPPMSPKPKTSQSPIPKAYIAGIREANQTHWAVVRTRPQKKRAESSSSTSSSGSNLSANSAANSFSTNATTLCGTPPVSPMGRIPPDGHYDNRQPAPTKQRTADTHANRLQSSRKQLAQQQKKSQSHLRQAQTSAPLPLKEEHLAHVPELPKPASMQQPADYAHGGGVEAAARHPQPIPRRRQERTTDSFYSFASDSTKLGEIPMHKWATPFDYEEMHRLNLEAGAGAWGSENILASGVLGKPTKKQNAGLFSRMFKKAPLSAIVES